MIPVRRGWWPLGLGLVAWGLVTAVGCYNTPVDRSTFSQGPAPLRTPSPSKDGGTYEDSLEGGQIFAMYCAGCHNMRPLSERPFSNYQNVAQHMRVRANLTGKEYAKLIAWMRRWHDVPPPVQDEVPPPKRFVFSQPNAELRDQQPKNAADLPAGPRPGFMAEPANAQPPPGNGPREGR